MDEEYDEEDIELAEGGDVMGDVMGMDVVGDDDDDDDDDEEEEVVGVIRIHPRTGRRYTQLVRRPKKKAKKAKKLMLLPKKASWRKHQLAPGVQTPGQGMVPLPLVGQAGAVPGLFAVGLAQITFSGQLQKPYRAERLLTSVIRNTATAVGRLLGVLYVGTDLQQAEIFGWDIELIGQPGSFGTRLTCKQAEPGVLIRMVVTCTPALTVAGDTIQANITFLGRVIA